MADGRDDLRWGMERRLEFIEFRLFWEGHVNRSDLMETFKVSIAQATTDLNRYLAMAPGNMAYDKSAKAYVRAPEFKPQFLEPDSSGFLTQLRSVADNIVSPEDTWIGDFPAFEAAPTPVRGVEPTILRAVLAAMRRHEAVNVRYQSLSRPQPRWRWIAPHALGHDGFRWHVRAWCEDDRAFKDFLLSRVLETGGTRPGDIDPADDHDWHEHVSLLIAPHPRLSETQQNVIALDYGMRDGKAELRVRRAFLYYALKRLGLDTDPAARRPQDQQIFLLNKDEIEGWGAAQGGIE